MSVTNWSPRPGGNAVADPAIPAQDSASARQFAAMVREVMAGVRRYADATGGALRTSGRLNAYVVDTGLGITDLRPGLDLIIQADRTNTAEATLNVDGLGPLPWVDAGGARLLAGRIVEGRFYHLLLDADAPAWRVQAGATTLDEIDGLIELRQEVAENSDATTAAAALAQAGAETATAKAAQAETKAAEVEIDRLAVGADRQAVADILALIQQIVANGVVYASQAQAEEGIANAIAMSPLRTTQHFQKRVGPWLRENGFLLAADILEARSKLGLSYSDQPAAEAGTATGAVMSPQRTTQHFNARVGPWLRESGLLSALDQAGARSALGAAPVSASRQSINYLTGTAGTGAAYTASPPADMPAVATRSVVAFVPHVDSEAAPTLSLDGGTTFSEIRSNDGSALAKGVLRGGTLNLLIFLSPFWRLVSVAVAELAAELAAVKAQLDRLGADGIVADIYDESTTAGTTSAVVVQADQPANTLAVQNRSDSATVTIELGSGAQITLAPYAQLDQKGVPPGPIRAFSSIDATPISILVGNNTRVSPNAPRRATALIRAMDAAASAAAGSTVKTSPAYEAAIRTLYYELDRLGVIQSAAGLFVLASETAAGGLVGWKSLTSATVNSAPVWAKGQGYTFDGVDDYLNTGRKMSDGPGVTPNSGAMAMFAKATATQLGKYGMGDGAWGIGPYRSGTTWGALVGATQADTIANAGADGDLYAWREDANAVFAAYQAQEAQRFERAARATLLNSTMLIGANSTSTAGSPASGSFFAGTAKVVWFGRPVGLSRWREARAAINAYLTTVAGIA